MARRRVVTTKYEIIQVASEFFMSVGYSNTSPKMIAEELGLSMKYSSDPKKKSIATTISRIEDVIDRYF